MALIYGSKLKEGVWVAVGGRSSVVRAPAAQAGGPGFDSRWLPCDFLFQQLTSLCLQNWMMSMSALVQVAAINGAPVQAAAIISALVQFGCYH